MSTRQSRFEALVQAYAPDLYRFAAWLGWRRDQAEDLVQDTFLRAWKALDDLQDPKAAKPWLIAILRREHARRFERTPLPCDPLEGVDLERMLGVDDGRHSIEVLLLRKALVALPQEQREALLLQVLGGYSCEEIAELLATTPGAVMTRLTRARQKLRQVLGGEDNERGEHEVGI
jgi:RNA polymerase sigma-70 factor, ECF subfamily